MTRTPASPAATAARLTWGALAGEGLDGEDRARLGLGLGGVVLFDRNVGSPGELRALTRAIRDASPGPVRISMDQEGGHIVRVGEPMTRFPGPMAIAATGSVRLAREVAAASGRELRSLGVDTVLAPVLDVAALLESPAVGARAFGDQAPAVGRFGAAAVQGYLEGGVLPVPKHFPGHGRAAEDSHVARPRVAGSPQDLRRADLPPFLAAVAAGAPMLMTGHVIYEALDRDRPASVSPATAHLARRQVGFDGALVTDALVMDAIADRMPLEEAGPRAILAGMDIAMAIEGQRPVLVGLATAIEGYEIPIARLRDALHRAARLQSVFDSLRGRPLGEPLRRSTLAAHARLAREVAERSLAIVAAADGVLPLDPGAGLLIVDVGGSGRSPVEGRAGQAPGAGERLRAVFGRSLVADVVADDVMGLDALVAAAAEAPVEAVVVLTRDAFSTPAATLPGRLGAGGRPVVHVALRNPLDLGVSAADVRIAAFADTPVTIDAIGEALSGRIAFRGRLPVRLPDAVAAGAAAFAPRGAAPQRAVSYTLGGAAPRGSAAGHAALAAAAGTGSTGSSVPVPMAAAASVATPVAAVVEPTQPGVAS